MVQPRSKNPVHFRERDFWRYRPDLNWRIRVLQTRALPLGYGTIYKNRNANAFLFYLIGAGDEARLHFAFSKITVSLRQAVASNSPPDYYIEWFEPKGPEVKIGAGDEARTRYLHLGKVALYRMSYTRIFVLTVGIGFLRFHSLCT